MTKPRPRLTPHELHMTRQALIRDQEIRREGDPDMRRLLWAGAERERQMLDGRDTALVDLWGLA